MNRPITNPSCSSPVKFGQGEFPYQRVGILLQRTERPSPDLFVAMLTEFDEPGVKLGQRTGGKDSEKIGEDVRLPFDPETLKDDPQIGFVGVPPPASEQKHLLSPSASRMISAAEIAAIRSLWVSGDCGPAFRSSSRCQPSRNRLIAASEEASRRPLTRLSPNRSMAN